MTFILLKHGVMSILVHGHIIAYYNKVGSASLVSRYILVLRVGWRCEKGGGESSERILLYELHSGVTPFVSFDCPTGTATYIFTRAVDFIHPTSVHKYRR